MYILLNKIKVDKKIKPVPYRNRKSIELALNRQYYVSFENNIAYPCRLIGFDDKTVSIEIPAKTKSKKVLRGIDGNVIDFPVDKHTLHLHCLGTTPEEAVINEVTHLNA